MVGADVEFLDEHPDEPVRTGASGQSDEPSSLTAGDIAAVAGWVAALALGVTATFRTVFTYRLDFSAVHSRGGYDAMGHSLDRNLSDDQGTNYAVALAVCIVLFGLLAVVIVRDARSAAGTRLGSYAPAIGIGAVALLTGILACIALGLKSSFASYYALAYTLDKEQANAVQLWIGGCLWFGLAAVVAGAIALALTIRRTPNARALPGRPAAGDEHTPTCGPAQQLPSRSDESDARQAEAVTPGDDGPVTNREVR